MKKINNTTIKLDDVSIENNKNVLVIVRYDTYGYDEGIYVLTKSEERGKYIITESYHCSCYGYDSTIYDGIEYTKKEIVKLGIAKLSGEIEVDWREKQFYKYVISYFLENKRADEYL